MNDHTSKYPHHLHHPHALKHPIEVVYYNLGNGVVEVHDWIGVPCINHGLVIPRDLATRLEDFLQGVHRGCGEPDAAALLEELRARE
jgi:hypothetical protein